MLPVGKRKLAKIETDLDRVRAIRHPHLLTLYGSRLTRYTPAFFPPNPHFHSTLRSAEGWSLVVLTEPVTNSQSLHDLLAAVGELRTDRALAYFAQIVQAVECLHLANIVHRGIRPRAVFVTNAKSGVEVKLAEAAWYQRVLDLNKAEPWAVTAGDEELPEAW